VDRPCGEPDRREHLPNEEHDRGQRQGRNEQPARKAEAAVEGLADAGDHGGQQARDHAPDVGRARIGGDAAGDGFASGRAGRWLHASGVRGHRLLIIGVPRQSATNVGTPDDRSACQ
jgi:hypothetical protein